MLLHSLKLCYDFHKPDATKRTKQVPKYQLLDIFDSLTTAEKFSYLSTRASPAVLEIRGLLRQNETEFKTFNFLVLTRVGR